jgi:Helix-turn-helix domain
MENTSKSITLSSDDRLGYGVLDLAQRFGFSPGFVRAERDRGHLKGIKLGRRLIFTKEAVMDWLNRAAAQQDAR